MALIPTLNKMGFMTDGLDDFSQDFVNFSNQLGKPVLDIGAAYGVATLACLKNGATVWANDIEPRHLQHIYNQATEEQKQRLQLFPGRFPDDLKTMDGSVSSVLTARILQFILADNLPDAFQKIYDWLCPKGRFYLVGETPYINILKSFIPEYEAQKKLGARWPGNILDVEKYTDNSYGVPLTGSFHMMDPEVVSRELEKIGFKILKTGFIPRVDFPEFLRLDGRESFGVIAEKI